jgi:transglutaminase-like putative cysteine protease
VLEETIEATPDARLPFLYPSQYVNFTENSEAVKLSALIVQGVQDEYEALSNIFCYVTQTIRYDYDKAQKAVSGEMGGYIPNIDETLSSKKGICFDYAVLMASMLRCQGIPSRLLIGYAGDIYHAWISVYIDEVGWLENIIYFTGDKWGRMDPTFVSEGQTSDAFLSNSNNYQWTRVY